MNVALGASGWTDVRWREAKSAATDPSVKLFSSKRYLNEVLSIMDDSIDEGTQSSSSVSHSH